MYIHIYIHRGYTTLLWVRSIIQFGPKAGLAAVHVSRNHMQSVFISLFYYTSIRTYIHVKPAKSVRIAIMADRFDPLIQRNKDRERGMTYHSTHPLAFLGLIAVNTRGRGGGL